MIILCIGMCSLSNPHFHSQSYLDDEYMLLCTLYRINCNQCIASSTSSNVTVTITNILAAVVGAAVLLSSVLRLTQCTLRTSSFSICFTLHL